MTKYLAAVIAALVLALGGLGLLYRSEVRSAAQQKLELKGATEALGRVEAQRKADQRTLVARSAAMAAQGRKLAQAQEALHTALQANSGWAGATVPPDVQSALLRRSERSKDAEN